MSIIICLAIITIYSVVRLVLYWIHKDKAMAFTLLTGVHGFIKIQVADMEAIILLNVQNVVNQSLYAGSMEIKKNRGRFISSRLLFFYRGLNKMPESDTKN